mmetsp:Transcript_93799/g.284860  ORF Transcript_93799/g.284860 Transcript_93799/m.284860 type:complete len:221 (-) Transcript_93799:13-675(-)
MALLGALAGQPVDRAQAPPQVLQPHAVRHHRRLPHGQLHALALPGGRVRPGPAHHRPAARPGHGLLRRRLHPRDLGHVPPLRPRDLLLPLRPPRAQHQLPALRPPRDLGEEQAVPHRLPRQGLGPAGRQRLPGRPGHPRRGGPEAREPLPGALGEGGEAEPPGLQRAALPGVVGRQLEARARPRGLGHGQLRPARGCGAAGSERAARASFSGRQLVRLIH